MTLRNIGIHQPNYTVSIQKTKIQNFSALWKPTSLAASRFTTNCTQIDFKNYRNNRLISSLPLQRTAPSLKKRYWIPQRDVKHTNPNAIGNSRPKIDSGCQRNVGGDCARLCRGRTWETPEPSFSSTFHVGMKVSHNQHWTYAEVQHDNNFQLLYPQRRSYSKTYWPKLLQHAVTGVDTNTILMYSTDIPNTI